MAELLAANQITIAKVLDGEKGEKGDKGDKGEQGVQGEKGEQGIQGPKGDSGADGKTSYFHIKYSSVANPTSSSEISETPKAYIGTYVDFTEADSTDPTKYTWSRFEGIQGEKGEQGIPGIGQDGRTSYLHIAYATSADGSEGFSVTESANKTYIGQYTDFTEADSTDYTKYAWTKIKGEMSAEQLAQLNQASEDASQAKTDVANLEIVGINLLLNSGFKNNADEWFTYGITDYIVKNGKQCAHMNFSVLKVTNFVRQSILGKLEPNTQYTMSAWVLTENVAKGTTNFACMFYHDGYYDNNGSSKWYSYGSKNLPINAGEWTHLEWTFTTDSTKLLNSTVSDIYIYARDMTGDIYFYDLKLEKGNKATDWTPAPEDVANAQTSADNAQTGVDSLNNAVFGVQTFEYILDGVTILVHKRGDGTYYYILNDEEVTVAEDDLVHDAEGELTSYQEGGVHEDLDNISNNIEAIGTKVNGFDARETAIYNAIADNSLIARKNARVEGNSLIITNDTATKDIASLLNYLQLNAYSIVIYGNGKDIVTIAKTADDSGYMKMSGTSMLQAQESKFSTIRLRSADGTGNLALVAGSDGHVSLREVLD